MRISSAALALGLLIAPASAQDAANVAIKAVKTEAKTALKDFKVAGADALVGLDADLAALEATLATDTTSATFVPELAGAAAAFAQAVAEAQVEAQNQVGFAIIGALDDLGGLTSLDGLYPEPLRAGQKGLLETHRVNLQKATTLLRTKALVRLGKTVKLAEQVSGLALRVTLRLDALPSDDVTNQGIGLSFFGLGPFMDVAVAGSRLDTTDDGVIVVAGHADVTDFDVHVALSGITTEQHDGTPDVQTTRFLVTLDNTGAGLPEGNYAAGAFQSGGQFGCTIGIGIR